jgi:hypothetical protein
VIYLWQLNIRTCNRSVNVCDIWGKVKVKMNNRPSLLSALHGSPGGGGSRASQSYSRRDDDYRERQRYISDRRSSEEYYKQSAAAVPHCKSSSLFTSKLQSMTKVQARQRPRISIDNVNDEDAEHNNATTSAEQLQQQLNESSKEELTNLMV